MELIKPDIFKLHELVLQQSLRKDTLRPPARHLKRGQPVTYIVLGFSLVLGFMVGLWMVFCALLFMNTWRVTYFGLLDELYNKIYVFVAVKWASMTMSAAAE
jgi:hypothetical protein